MELRVPLQVGLGTLNGILDGVAESLDDPFLVVKNYPTRAK